MKHDFRKLAKMAAQAAADKKAVEIQIYDLRETSDVSDYVVVAGAESTTQLRALQDAVRDALVEGGARPLHADGREAGKWVALDYGGLIVHILLTEAREFYRLDYLWENPTRVKWAEAAPPTRKKKKRA